MKNKYYLLSLFALASASAFGATVVKVETGGTVVWSEISQDYQSDTIVNVTNSTIITVDANDLTDFQFESTDNSGTLNLMKSDTFTNFVTANGGGRKLLKVNLQASDTGKVAFNYDTNGYAAGASIPFERFKYDMGGNEVTFNAQGYTFGMGSGSTLDKYSKLTINAKKYTVNTTTFQSSNEVVINTDEEGGVTQLGGTVVFNGKTTINTSTLNISGITVFKRTSSSTGLITINANEIKGTTNAMIVGRGSIQQNIVINGSVDLSGTAQKVFLNSTTSLTLNGDSKLNIFDLTDNVGDDGLYYKDTTIRTQGAVTTKLTIGSGADVSIKTLGMYNTNSVLNIEFANATGSLTIDAFDIIADGYDADHIAGTGDIGISIVGSVFEQIKIKEGIKVGDTVVDENNFTNYFTAEEGKTLSLTSAGDGYYYVNATTAVPEPAEWAMIFGAIALGFVAYRRRK